MYRMLLKIKAHEEKKKVNYKRLKYNIDII